VNTPSDERERRMNDVETGRVGSDGCGVIDA
jgi:hypothetical protein